MLEGKQGKLFVQEFVVLTFVVKPSSPQKHQGIAV